MRVIWKGGEVGHVGYKLPVLCRPSVPGEAGVSQVNWTKLSAPLQAGYCARESGVPSLFQRASRPVRASCHASICVDGQKPRASTTVKPQPRLSYFTADVVTFHSRNCHSSLFSSRPSGTTCVASNDLCGRRERADRLPPRR